MGARFLIFTLTFCFTLPCFGKVIACQDLLHKNTPSAQAIDFVVSDLEGLFMDLVSDVARLEDPSISNSNGTRMVEVFFKKKAEFFNRFTMLMSFLRSGQTTPSVDIPQLALMSYYLGVKPGNFGFQINEQGQIYLPIPVAKKPQRIGFVQFPDKKEELVKKPPIGFTRFSDASEELSEKSAKKPRYSIGFGEMVEKQDEVPLRRGGGIQFFELKPQGQVAVGDFEMNKISKVSRVILSATELETDEKKMAIIYNKAEGEWIVSFENKANPSGQMGFVPVKTEE